MVGFVWQERLVSCNCRRIHSLIYITKPQADTACTYPGNLLQADLSMSVLMVT